jgi:hypothetical protein
MLRVFGPVIPGNYATALYLEAHPWYGFFHVPRSSAWIKTDEYINQIAINELGLRDREIGYEKPAGTRRILVLGDSFVEGAQVPFDSMLTRRLAAELCGSSLDTTCEVINAGVSGWGTAQELVYLRHEGLRYQPDAIVLIFYTGNDVPNNTERIKRTEGGPRKPTFELTDHGELREVPFRARALREEEWLDTLRRTSLLFAALDRAIFVDVAGRLANEPLDDVSDDSEHQLVLHELPVYSARVPERWEAAWTITEALISAVSNEAERAGVPFLLVDAPTKWEIYSDDWESMKQRNGLPSSGWNMDGPRRRLASFASRAGIEWLDLRPAMDAAADGPRLYFHQDIHWTSEGHRVAAAQVARALLQQSAAATPIR